MTSFPGFDKIKDESFWTNRDWGGGIDPSQQATTYSYIKESLCVCLQTNIIEILYPYCADKKFDSE